MKSLLIFAFATVYSGMVLAETTSLECSSQDKSVVLSLDTLQIGGEALIAADMDINVRATKRTFNEFNHPTVKVADMTVLKVLARKQITKSGGMPCEIGNTETHATETYKMLVSIDTTRGYSIGSIVLNCIEKNYWESTCDR